MYKFCCSCGCSYMGRTKRSLTDRMAEHLPRWLMQGETSRPRSTAEPSSAITRHLVHCPAFDRAKPRIDFFTIVTRARCPAILPLLEATYIVTFNPDLCAQKDFVFSLGLPWR